MSENINKLISQLSSQLNMSPEQLKNSAESGDVNGILKNAESKQAQQAREILSDPEKTKQILNSPQAQAIIKMLNNKK